MEWRGIVRSARGVYTLGAVMAAMAAVPAVTIPLAAQQGWEEQRIPAVFLGDEPLVFEFAGAQGSFLGVGVAEIDASRSKALKLKEEAGVEVTRVEQDSPAEKAGLKVGDVVLEFNGQRVDGTEQFVRLVRETPSGRTARLLISRNGTQQTLSAAIGVRRGMTSGGAEMLRALPRMEMPEIQIPDVPKAYMTWRSARLGIDAESVESQLAEFFGVKEGVLVRSVIRESAAEKAGIRAGDVITKIDNSQVTSPRDITTLLRGLHDMKSVPVTLVREKREMTVTVTMEGESPGQWDRIHGKPVNNQTKL
jgi:serine protease Do